VSSSYFRMQPGPVVAGESVPRRYVPTPLSGAASSPLGPVLDRTSVSSFFSPSRGGAATEHREDEAAAAAAAAAEASLSGSARAPRSGSWHQAEAPALPLTATVGVAVAAATRFPAVRSVLWDCSPQGAPVELRPARLLPEVQLAAAVVEALIFAQPGQYYLTGKEVARRDRPGRREGRSPLFVAEALAACRFSPEDIDVTVVEGDEGGFYVPAETLCLEAGGLGALVEAAHDALGHPGPLGALGRFRVRILAAGNRRTRSLAVAAHCVYVPAACSLTPILPCRVLPTQLSVAVGQVGAARETGFITMDDARRVVLLAGALWADHALVGVWAAGVDGPEDPLVWGACLRFAYSRAIPDRATQRGGFLVVLYLADAIVPSFFHCRPREPDTPFTHLSLARNVGMGDSDLVLRFKDAVPDPRGAEEVTSVEVPRSHIPVDTNEGSGASSPLRTPSRTPAAAGSPPRSVRGGGASSRGTNSLANSISGGFQGGHTLGQTVAVQHPLQGGHPGLTDLSGGGGGHVFHQQRRHAGSTSSRGSSHHLSEAASALPAALQTAAGGSGSGVVIVERSAYEAQQRLVQELTLRVDDLQQQIRAVLGSGALAGGQKGFSPSRAPGDHYNLRQDSIASSSDDPFVLHVGNTPSSRGGAGGRASGTGGGARPGTLSLIGSSTPLAHESVLSPLGGVESLLLSSSPTVSPPRLNQHLAPSPPSRVAQGSYAQDYNLASSSIDIPRIIDLDQQTGGGTLPPGSPGLGAKDRNTEALFLKYLGLGSETQQGSIGGGGASAWAGLRQQSRTEQNY
jgi:hypothetical protein